MKSPAPEEAPPRPHPTLSHIRRVEVVINSGSGDVNSNSAEQLETRLDLSGLESRVSVLEPGAIDEGLRAAVDRGPDLLITLAGDGTANRAAELCGADGPLLAPLPGGTMNMLPRALYGDRSWPDALDAALATGVERPVSGGEIDGLRFHCVAILGSPALWAPAREAARVWDLRLAWEHAVFAFQQAFSSQLRFQIDGGGRQKALALSLICPLVSRALHEERALEAAVLDLHDATQVFRLGLYDVLGDWRDDPGVFVQPCVHGRAWAHHPIPCLLDGEMHTLQQSVTIRFRPRSFRALAPRHPAAKDAAPRT